MKKYDPLDVFKAVGALAILIAIVTFSTYYYQVEEERLQQEELEELQVKEEAIKSLRLIIRAPHQVHVNEETPIEIKVVDSNGTVVASRDDIIEVSLLTQGKSVVGIKRGNRITWSASVDLNLKEGVGEVWFKAIDIETVTILAKQLSGKTPLEETRTMFILLRERTQ